jgi:hypothetical protein
MTNASRSDLVAHESLPASSLGTAAAALAVCLHPEASHLGIAGDLATGTASVAWCVACGALCSQTRPMASWQLPALTSNLTKKYFEDLVLLLHAIVQLAVLARSHASPSASGLSDQVFLRNLRISLAEIARLPVVRDVDRLEEAIAAMPRSGVRP